MLFSPPALSMARLNVFVMDSFPEDLDEFQEKIAKASEYMKKEFEGYDYYAVMSLTKIYTDGKVQSVSQRATSITSTTAFEVVKGHVANIIFQTQVLLKLYEPVSSSTF